jgi:hypothetical protein
MIRSVDSDTQIKLFNWTSFTNGTSYSISKAVLSNINGNKTFQFGTPGQSLLSSDGNESVLTVMNSNASSGFGTIRIMGNAPTNAGIGQGFVCNIIGERYARNVFYNDGVIGWSPGTATRDVFLSRDTTNSLTIGTNPWDLVTTSNRTANLNVYGSQTISNYNDNTYQLNLIANKTNSTGRAGIRMEYGGNAASIQHQNNELLLTQSTTTVDYNQFQMTDTRICLNNGAKDIDFVVNKLTTDSAIYYDAGLDVTKIGANTAGNYVSIDGSGDITMVGTAELNAHTIISPFVKQRQIIDYCTVSADSAPFRRYSNGTGASIAKSAAVAGVFGGLDMTTGSLTTGTAEIYSEKFHVMSTEKYSCYARFKTPAVMPSASDAYRIVFGFYQAADSTTVGGTDSIMIRVGRNTVDGEIAYVTRNNGTGDSTGRYTGIRLSGATYYDFRIDVNATGTSSDFYYKTRAATSWTTIATGVTTNMPTNRGGLFFGMFLWNGNPATTRTLILNEIALTKTLP